MKEDELNNLSGKSSGEKSSEFFLFGKHQRDGNVFDAGVVSAGEFGKAGDLQVSMFWWILLRPGSQVFQRLRDPEPVLVGLDGIAPGDLQLPALTGVSEDIGAGLCFRDRQGPAAVAWEIVPVELLTG